MIEAVLSPAHLRAGRFPWNRVQSSAKWEAKLYGKVASEPLTPGKDTMTQGGSSTDWAEGKEGLEEEMIFSAGQVGARNYIQPYHHDGAISPIPVLPGSHHAPPPTRRNLLHLIRATGGFLPHVLSGSGHAQTGGLFPAHGRACSNWAARRNRVASSPKGATKWAPTGRPPGVQCRGTLMAGWPVALNTAV